MNISVEIESEKMTSKGTSQAGTLGQPPTALCATRASLRQMTVTPPNGGIASPVDKGKIGEKCQTTGKQSRQVLINVKCLGLDEQVTPSTMYKLFDRILHEYVLRHSRDIHLTWVKSSIETLSNKGLGVLSTRAKSEEDFDSY